jgi:hypothetical protein
MPGTAQPDPERLALILQRIATSDAKPDFLIIDDVVDIGLVQTLPTDLPFTLIVTTRRAVPNMASTVRVDPLTADEAAEMIRSQLAARSSQV